MCVDLGSSLPTEERSGIKSSTESDRVVQSDGLYVRRDNARLGPVRKRNNCLADYSGFHRYYLAYLEGAIADDSSEFESSGAAAEPKAKANPKVKYNLDQNISPTLMHHDSSSVWDSGLSAELS